MSRTALGSSKSHPRVASVRVLVLYALAWLVAAWAVFLVARASDLWILSFAALAMAAWGVGRDISEDGYLQPVLAYSFIALAVTLVGTLWMAVLMGRAMPYFWGYKMPVTPNSIFILSGEQMILFTASYAGYLIVRGISRRQVEYASVRVEVVDRLWFVFYVTGILALLAFILSTGGLADLTKNIGEKSELREGRGELVLLYLLGYSGALLWFKKNLLRPVWLRYGGLVLLLLPLLAFGSRTPFLAVLVAAAFMDERVGRRISLKAAVLAGISLVVFFSAYVALRGGLQLDILRATRLDLSMGTGYVIAVQEGIFEVHTGGLAQLWTVLNPILPSPIRGYLDVPPTANAAFTKFLFPTTENFTASMGVMGEAHYLVGGWSFLYYLVIGIVLTWVGIYGWRKSLILSALVAGFSWEIVKDGFLVHLSWVLTFALPIIFAYIALIALSRLLVERPEENPS
jgi:hypothetical protein